MTETQAKLVLLLETEWSEPNGFLAKTRAGRYDPEEGKMFILMLRGIKLREGQSLDRRLISLLWYIPLFLTWQKARIAKNGGDSSDFEKISNQATTIVEEILGVP